MVSIFLSSGLCVLQAHRHLGGGGQLLVPNIGLRQGVWQQITGDAFSCPHILPWATRRCPIQRTSQGRPDNQVGGLDTWPCHVNMNQTRWVQNCRYPLTHLHSASHLSQLQVKDRKASMFVRDRWHVCPGDSTFPPGRLPTSNLANLPRPRPRPPSPHRPCPARGAS